MTKTAATKTARRTLSYGHFRSGYTFYSHCPTCNARVESDVREKEAGLRDALVDHLIHDCEAQ
jgi:hypothetical protein